MLCNQYPKGRWKSCLKNTIWTIVELQKRTNVTKLIMLVVIIFLFQIICWQRIKSVIVFLKKNIKQWFRNHIDFIYAFLYVVLVVNFYLYIPILYGFSICRCEATCLSPRWLLILSDAKNVFLIYCTLI